MSTNTIEQRSSNSRPRMVAKVLGRPLSIEVANPWRGRQFPCSAQEEGQMVTDLEDLCSGDRGKGFERGDVTVLLTALRGGLNARALLDQAPGARAARLLAAHRELDHRRLLAEHAWRTIVVDQTPETLAMHGACAAELLPAVISHLAAHHHDSRRHDARRLAHAIGEAAEQVNRTSQQVDVLERLTQSIDEPERARVVGTLLYDIHGQGVWSLPTFLPPRVGTLVPLRVAALLGDDVTAIRRIS